MSKLHEFDLFACRDLHSMLHGNLEDERFVEVLSRLSPKLREYLRTDPYPDDDEASTRQLLLDDGDFAQIHNVLWERVDFLRERLDLCRGDQPRSAEKQSAYRKEIGAWRWRWSPLLHNRAIRCLSEIRRGMTERQAELWERRSDKYELRLKRKPLRLDEGIKVIWKWVNDARDLLIALGHTELVPIPHGRFPTPQYPAGAHSPIGATGQDISGVAPSASAQEPTAATSPTTQKSKGRRGKSLADYMDRLLEAIEQLSPNASATTLIKKARVSRGKGLDALKKLHELGKWQGYKRAPRVERKQS